MPTTGQAQPKSVSLPEKSYASSLVSQFGFKKQLSMAAIVFFSCRLQADTQLLLQDLKSTPVGTKSNLAGIKQSCTNEEFCDEYVEHNPSSSPASTFQASSLLPPLFDCAGIAAGLYLGYIHIVDIKNEQEAYDTADEAFTTIKSALEVKDKKLRKEADKAVNQAINTLVKLYALGYEVSILKAAQDNKIRLNRPEILKAFRNTQRAKIHYEAFFEAFDGAQNPSKSYKAKEAKALIYGGEMDVCGSRTMKPVQNKEYKEQLLKYRAEEKFTGQIRKTGFLTPDDQETAKSIDFRVLENIPGLVICAYNQPGVECEANAGALLALKYAASKPVLILTPDAIQGGEQRGIEHNLRKFIEKKKQVKVNIKAGKMAEGLKMPTAKKELWNVPRAGMTDGFASSGYYIALSPKRFNRGEFLEKLGASVEVETKQLTESIKEAISES